MRRMLALMLTVAGPRRREYVGSLWATVVGAFAQAAGLAAMIPLLMELASPEPAAGTVWTWVAVVVVLTVLDSALRAREIDFEYTHWGAVLEDLRLRLGEKLRTMPQRELERRASGDLTTVVGGNAANAGLSISAVALLFVQTVVVPAVLLVVVLVVDWRLGLVLLVCAPLALPFVRRIQTLSGAGFRRTDAADAAAAARVVEYVQGLPVFKATGQTGRSSVRLQRALAEQGERMAETQKALTTPSLVAGAAVQLAVVALAAVGAALVLGADLSVPLLIALVAAAVRFAEPLAVATMMTALFEIADAALERVGEVLDTRPLAADPEVRLTAHDVAFEEVDFGYEEGVPVLRGLSFRAPARSLTALVGPSGSGKTTVTRLVGRYADPSAGVVRIGGTDLSTVDPVEVHRHVSVVFQDVYLFDDTIRANIAMGRPGATDAEVTAAARAANVHTFVERLPHGYDTRVGEIGGALSGGERQRISIARAILKDAPVVVLDEPTAALDAESETAVQDALDALVAERTVIVIAHRLSTVVAADQILVLEAGRIVERGTHEGLLDADGRYADMWRAQTRARHWKVEA